MQSNYLIHHGTKGQKWGIRKYQNEDGTLTDAGRERYLKNYEKKEADNILNEYADNIIKSKKFKGEINTLKTGIKNNDQRAISITTELLSLKTTPKPRWDSNDVTIPMRDYQFQSDLGKAIYNRLKNQSINHNDISDSEDYIEHFGIKGQKWGVRRFETESGHLTEAGKDRYLDKYDDEEARRQAEEERRAKERKKKIIIGTVVTAAAVTAGVIIYKKFKKQKLENEDLKKKLEDGKDKAKEIIEDKKDEVKEVVKDNSNKVKEVVKDNVYDAKKGVSDTISVTKAKNELYKSGRMDPSKVKNENLRKEMEKDKEFFDNIKKYSPQEIAKRKEIAAKAQETKAAAKKAAKEASNEALNNAAKNFDVSNRLGMTLKDTNNKYNVNIMKDINTNTNVLDRNSKYNFAAKSLPITSKTVSNATSNGKFTMAAIEKDLAQQSNIMKEILNFHHSLDDCLIIGDYLIHHGIKGQKHGIRRYQNEDGSLTAAGRQHYGVGPAREQQNNKNIKQQKQNVKPKEETKKLTDEEYNKKLETMIRKEQLEKQYEREVKYKSLDDRITRKKLENNIRAEETKYYSSLGRQETKDYWQTVGIAATAIASAVGIGVGIANLVRGDKKKK